MRFPFLLSALLAATAAVAQPPFYDRHVMFDNSLADGGYDSSLSYLVAPSTLETFNGKFPVEPGRFVSPPNALRLKWRSATGGDWRMTLEIPRRYARPCPDGAARVYCRPVAGDASESSSF